MRGLAVLLGALAVAGCGGSTSTSASTTSTAPLTAPPLTTTTRETGTQTTVTLTKTATTPTTAKTTAGPPTGSINVRVPARFTIAADGSVSPRTVTIPAHLPVELVLVSNGGAHRITVRKTTFTVPAHGQTEKLIDGLKAGSYPLKVDGAPKAVLTIGGEPGP